MKLHKREDWDKVSPKDKWSNNCVLCSWYKSEDSQYIIKTFNYWHIVHNKYPVLWLDTHLMAIPKRHVILSKDLDGEELTEYKDILSFMHDFFKWEKYFSFIRESPKSRSLEHLHYHFLPWCINYKDIELFLTKQGF